MRLLGPYVNPSRVEVATSTSILSFGDKGLITLNKPQAMNTLTGSMLKKINEVLRQWESTKQIVMIKGADEKVFCAGGDIKKISFDLSKPGGTEIVRDAFRQLYICLIDIPIGSFKCIYAGKLLLIKQGANEGGDYGDEYFAILNYVEVVEAMKANEEEL
ncbi:hypothetical protein HCN44_004728 [Aphidius gifuensis]|uniref:3-hydroxyisobutyryl-CoA hydrolase, mitochondrial n=1 Tax=Aphidius gifuensis TaxID=684658 RepID=A0A834XZR4_APHGI|nr:hypothetical protein HCN44_004728 [Aphidius gifuensis]